MWSSGINRIKIMYSPTTTTNRVKISNEQKSSHLLEEVAILMKASGDSVEQQQRDSIVLVEKILIQQLRSVLELAMDVCHYRTSGNSSTPTIQDFEYLLHRNKPKLIRFRKFMRNVQKMQIKKSEPKQPGGSGGNFGVNFLNRLTDDSVTTDNEEEEIFDSEKIRRM